jgi:hypothetical protein
MGHDQTVTRRIIRNVEEERAEAKRIRETFMDRPARKVEHMGWSWPSSMREVGECVAVMYSSDKWQDIGDYADYKHVAEGPQLVCVKDGFLLDEDGEELDVCGPRVELNGNMPTSIATLAPIIGIQIRLYEPHGKGHRLPKDGSLYHVGVRRAKIGAARHPDTGEVFLCVFSKDDVAAIITGRHLDVLKDGIVG